MDYSSFLVDVANGRFARRPAERYLMADALEYLYAEENPRAFTKAVCYGAFPYFDDNVALQILQVLNAKFERASRVFLGQIPDKTRLNAFYADRVPVAGEVDHPGGPLGMWRTPDEMLDLAQKAGWHAQCNIMPPGFFAAHYRFDVILTRT